MFKFAFFRFSGYPLLLRVQVWQVSNFAGRNEGQLVVGRLLGRTCPQPLLADSEQISHPVLQVTYLVYSSFCCKIQECKKHFYSAYLNTGLICYLNSKSVS